MKLPRNFANHPNGPRAGAAPPPRLSVSLLGQPRVELDGVTVKFDRRKAVAILTFLAVTGERHAREKLTALLRPDEDQSASLASLRNRLTSLRHAIGPE